LATRTSTSLSPLALLQILAHVLNPGDIPVIQTDRGGEVTFHGPGQLVIYFLLDIKQKKLGPKALVANLQNLNTKHTQELLH
jgi:lipoate-protein ligase B